MNRIIFPALILLLVTVSGCVMNRLNPEEEVIYLKGGDPELTIRVIKGETWTEPMKAGPLVFNVLAQAVFWVEDDQGRFVETLYVSGADYGKMRHAGKSEMGEDFYRESFPLWSARAEGAGVALPSKDNPYPDTMTSATPSNSFTLVTSPGSQKSLVLYGEINRSQDYNARYTKDNSGWTGQPALVYRCPLDSIDREIPMDLVGHSGLPGDLPRIYEDETGLDTALDMVASIRVARGAVHGRN